MAVTAEPWEPEAAAENRRLRRELAVLEDEVRRLRVEVRQLRATRPETVEEANERAETARLELALTRERFAHLARIDSGVCVCRNQ